MPCRNSTEADPRHLGDRGTQAELDREYEAREAELDARLRALVREAMRGEGML